jgi:hypothetical protein
VTVASRARRALDPGRLDPTLKSYQGFGFEFLTPRTAAAASAIPSKRFSHFGFRIHSSSTMLDEVIIIDDHPPPHQPYRIPRIISLDSDIIVIDSEDEDSSSSSSNSDKSNESIISIHDSENNESIISIHDSESSASILSIHDANSIINKSKSGNSSISSESTSDNSSDSGDFGGWFDFETEHFLPFDDSNMAKGSRKRQNPEQDAVEQPRRGRSRSKPPTVASKPPPAASDPPLQATASCASKSTSKSKSKSTSKPAARKPTNSEKPYDLEEAFEAQPVSFSLAQMHQTLKKNQTLFGCAKRTQALRKLQVNSKSHEEKKNQVEERLMYVLSQVRISVSTLLASGLNCF